MKFFTATLITFFICGNALSNIYNEQMIAPIGESPAMHGSSIVELKNGNLLSCWFAGTKEAHPDTQIFCRDYIEGVWQNPRVVVARGEKAIGDWDTLRSGDENSIVKNKKLGNSVLFKDDSGFLWLFYNVVPEPAGGWALANIHFKVSPDDGKTWSPGYLFEGSPGAMVRNSPLKLKDNEYLLPVYNENGSLRNGFKKFGYSWRLTLKNGIIEKRKKAIIPGTNHLQGALVKKDENTVFSYLRNRESGKTYFASYKIDQNKWSDPSLIDLANSNSPLAATNTSDGKILIVFNDSPKRPRTPLSLAISEDGINFKVLFQFESNPNDDNGYPNIIQASNGLFHVNYTHQLRKGIKHVTFDNEWLEALLANSFY